MTLEQIDKEIFDLTVKLNKALGELAQEGNGFIDKNPLRMYMSLTKNLQK